MKFLSTSLKQTEKIAALVRTKIVGGEVILLNGEIGAGKTTFTKFLAKSLKIKGAVLSPTFTIIKEYQGKTLKLIHIDMYRIEKEDEIYELGIEDVFSQKSVVVIEWNKYKNLIGKVINIDIEVQSEDKRIFKISGL